MISIRKIKNQIFLLKKKIKFQDQMNKLYEEMEQQLAKERSEIKAEEERKEKKIQKEFEIMIQMKDSQMQVS